MNMTTYRHFNNIILEINLQSGIIADSHGTPSIALYRPVLFSLCHLFLSHCPVDGEKGSAHTTRRTLVFLMPFCCVPDSPIGSAIPNGVSPF